MRKLISKTTYALGVFTLFFGIYISTFYVAKNKIIHPYESVNRPQTHSLRPLYNVVYYPLRILVANGSASKIYGIHKVYFGTLEMSGTRYYGKKKHSYASIYTQHSTIDFVFVGETSVLDEFDKVEDGSYVRLVFDVVFSREHDDFINLLISFEVIDLMDDPRMEDESFSDEERQEIQDAYFGLKGDANICAEKFTRAYQDKVLEHCLQAGYAQNIGGGCYHLVPYSVTTIVKKTALNKCSVEN